MSNVPFRVVLMSECPACQFPISARTLEAVREHIAEHEAIPGHTRGLSWPVSEVEFSKAPKVAHG